MEESCEDNNTQRNHVRITHLEESCEDKKNMEESCEDNNTWRNRVRITTHGGIV